MPTSALNRNKVNLSVSKVPSDVLPVFIVLDLLVFFLLVVANAEVVHVHELEDPLAGRMLLQESRWGA